MRLRRIALGLTAVMIVAVVASLVWLEKALNAEIDSSEVNRIAVIAENNWDNLQDKYFDDIDSDFVLLDDKNKVKYASYEAETADGEEIMMQALKDSDSIIEIKPEDRVCGKAIVHNMSAQRELITKALRVLLLAMGSVCVLCVMMFSVYAHKRILAPFARLKGFAGQIAAGNLDAPLNMDKDNIFGAFTESFDIMREQLQQARQSEYEANVSKKELVAQLAHDIKTPLASIKAVCEAGCAVSDSEKERARLDNIQAKASQIERLTNDLFSTTLEELNELSVEPVLNDSRYLYDMFEDIGCCCEIEQESCPECLVLFDKLRIRQVIDNIVANSIKYAKTKITVSYAIVDDIFMIKVRDYGEGVVPEELPHISEKYYRGEAAKASQASGSGLGLYIARQFIERMGGELICENSEPGLTVTMVLRMNEVR